MYREILLTTIASAILTIPTPICAGSSKKSVSDAHYSLSSDYPKWPLNLLTKVEREARLEFFTSLAELRLSGSENASEAECNAIYDDVASKRYTVLEPYYSSERITEETLSHLGTCEDAIFQSTSIPGCTQTPTANFEAYNLSKFFPDLQGSPAITGAFAEGNVLNCTTESTLYEEVKQKSGYQLFAGSGKSAIFKKDDCQILEKGSAFANQRITPSLTSPIQYKVHSSFYGFAESQAGHLLMFSLASLPDADSFADIMNAKGVTLTLEIVNLDGGKKCTFTRGE